MFVIVWLLPVPGGPCKTKFLPLSKRRSAARWEQSEASGNAASVSPSPSVADTGASDCALPVRSASTARFFLNSPKLCFKSFHIKKR